MMIRAVHQQRHVQCASFVQLPADSAPSRASRVVSCQQIGTKLVSRAREMVDERAFAAWRGPPEHVALRESRTAEAAPQDDQRTTEVSRDLRQHGRMSK